MGSRPSIFQMTVLRTIKLGYEEKARSYEIAIGEGLLEYCGNWVRETIPSARKLAVVSNPTVYGIYGEKVTVSLDEAGFDVSFFLMPDGEEFKNLEVAEKILNHLNENGISREDAVVALGGGVVGDIAGFAASIHLRGISFMQIPTTLLAMVDSSVGGKTGVNSGFGKNLIGSFHQPAGVLADVATLATLDPREIAAGMYEAVKQAALAGKEELGRLGDFLRANDVSSVPSLVSDATRSGELCGLLAEQVSFKASVVGGDARESTARTDGLSRKILNFGHTTAHALEKCAGYGALRHGEAVGYGMLVAGELSKRLEICSSDSIDLLNDVVRTVGVLPGTGNISVDDVLDAIELDKKSGGGSVQWILLEDIGKPLIVSGQDIQPKPIRESIEHVISRKTAD